MVLAFSREKYPSLFLRIKLFNVARELNCDVDNKTYFGSYRPLVLSALLKSKRIGTWAACAVYLVHSVSQSGQTEVRTAQES